MRKLYDAQYRFLKCIQSNQATLESIAEHLANGATLEAKTVTEDNIFHVAADSGACDSIIALIDYMKQTTPVEKKSFLVWLDHSVFTDDAELPTAALQLLKAKNIDGLTPLHRAALGGHDDCVRLLLTKASTSRFKDKFHRTPLTCAAQQGHLSTVMILRENFAELHLDKHEHAQPIHFAAWSGNAGLVNFFFKNGVPLFVFDARGLLPSCYAAMRGHISILHLFRQKGDKLDGKQPFSLSFLSSGSETPMKYAALSGQLTTIRYLANTGVDVRQNDRRGFPPIHHAAAANQTQAIDLLADLGADFQSLTEDKQLPIQRVQNYYWKQQFWRRYGMSASKEAYQYALLCYMSSFNHPEDRKTLTNTAEEKTFVTAEKHIALQGWKRFSDCLEVCSDEPQLLQAIEEYHYYGIIYYRESPRHVEFVIAHRGTDLTSTPNLVADGQIMAREIPGLLTAATLPFINTFLARLNATQDGLTFNHKPVKSIMHVGFSLGGFLAAAAAVKTHSPITFAKTFDAPGIDFLVDPQEEEIYSPQIENYVAYPNLVNACNRHVGSIFQISCVPVNDNQDQQHDVVFEVPSTTLISHFFETLRRHDLRELIETNLNRQGLYLRAVSQWPQATIELVYGPDPRNTTGFFNKVQSLVKSVVSMKVWNAMQRQGEDGQAEGLLAVKHRCDYTVEYLYKGDQRLQSRFSY